MTNYSVERLDRIEHLKEYFKDDEEVISKLNEIAEGYRHWVRHVIIAVKI